MRVEAGTAAIEHNSPMVLRDVPAQNVHDASFWCVLLHFALNPEFKGTAGAAAVSQWAAFVSLCHAAVSHAAERGLGVRRARQ